MSMPRAWREFEHRYTLVGTRCPSCNKVYFPPRDVCPTCHRESVGKMEKIKLKPEGTVYSFTVVHQDIPGFKEQKPYIIGIIEMVDGPKITAQIVDIDPAKVSIGMPVHAVFRKIREEGKAGIIEYGYKFAPL